MAYLQDFHNALSKSIETLQSVLMIHPVEGNLTILPICDFVYSGGPNEGKCVPPLLPTNNYTCGEFGVINEDYIGVAEVCPNSTSQCTVEGPNGLGIPEADYLLFVSAESSGKALHT